MIILYVRGGLGNQLSQVAYTYILAKKKSEEIYIDSSSYQKYKIRGYSLEHLMIADQLKDISQAGLSSFQRKNLVMKRKGYHLIEKIGTHIVSEMGESVFCFLAHRGCYYNFDSTYYGYPEAKKNCQVKDVYGYFLAERYFRENREELLHLFSVKDEVTDAEERYLGMIRDSNAVAISMRLQDDYANNPVANVCDKRYFVSAVQLIKEKVQDPHFFIFADDIDRARGLNLPVDAVYIEGMKDYQGLRLLYHCKHYIISNSSFSWWGAYLSRNQNRIIVAPEKWMNTNKNDYHDKYYSNMIRM